jgi:hypothetical protein
MAACLAPSAELSSSIHLAPHDAQKARRRGLTTMTIRIDRQTGQHTVVISLTSSERIRPSISAESRIFAPGARAVYGRSP